MDLAMFGLGLGLGDRRGIFQLDLFASNSFCNIS